MNESIFSLNELKSSGLNSEYAKKQLDIFGPNQLVGKKPPTDLYFVFKQFQNPLVLVLIIATIITAIVGDFSDAFVISLAIIVNTILGFIQERKAYKSLDALKKVVTHEAWVIRNNDFEKIGQKIKIEISKIVPGDIVVLYEGDKVPADGIIIEDNDLLINEALLTGESVPVSKKEFKSHISEETINEFIIQATKTNNSKTINILYMGTTVVGGSGKVLVTSTGMKTEWAR